MFEQLNASVANQKSDKAQFENFASPQQSSLFNVAQASGSLADRGNSFESAAIQHQPTHTSLDQIGIVPDERVGNVAETIVKIRSVEPALVSQPVNHCQDLRKKAIIT